LRIAVLHGVVPPEAPPDEQDVLVEAEVVSSCLRSQGHTVERIEFSLSLPDVIARLRGFAPDLAFNLVESVEGKGRLAYFAPGLLDSLGIPYTGCPAEAFFLTGSKTLAKRIMQQAGIPTPLWLSADSAAVTELDGSPWIVKSVWEHASIGIGQDNVVADSALAAERIREGPDERFAERFIHGREFNLSLLGFKKQPELLPPAEIQFIDFPDGQYHIVDYRAKWDEQSFEYKNTVRTFQFGPDMEPVLNRLALVASQCWTVFGLRGYARVDFRVDRNGEPWVLEVNTNPCISPDGGLMAAARQAGYDHGTVIARIVAEAL